MENLLQKIWANLRSDQMLPFETILFRLIALSVSLLLLFLVLPVNLLQHFPLLLNLIILAFAAASYLFYRASLRGRTSFKSFFQLALLVLNATWLLNAGSSGSIPYFFFAAALYPLIFFHDSTRWWGILLVGANHAALLVLEYHYPFLVTPFQNRSDRLLDLSSGFFFGEILCVLIFWVLMTKHRTEMEERSRAEQELRNSQALLNSLVEGSSDAIFVKDTTGRYLLFNSASTRITEKEAAEVIGRDDFALFSIDVAARMQADDQAVLESGTSMVYEREITSASGRQTTVFATKGPLRDANGRIIGVYGISRDVTDIRRAERLLAETKERHLEELNVRLEQRVIKTVAELREKDQLLIQQSRLAAMGEMIGNIAHQWRQPLNNLGLLIQQLQIFRDMGQLERELLDENVSKAMQVIQHMSKTITDFSDFFRPDKTKTTFPIAAVIRDTIRLLGAGLSHQPITIDIDQQGDPQAVGFQNEYAQVVLIILQNARDAFRERQITDPRIVISIFSQGGRAVATFADNGGGIPAGIIDRIFDPYFTTKQASESIGIGLFMSKRIIENNMEGTLSVRNTDCGAEFRIVI